jgi:serine/threonine protein kinase
LTFGNSSYGSVFKAIRKSDGMVVAIKQVPIDEEIEELRKEIDIMKECSSPFIISYEGTYFNENNEIWVCLIFSRSYIAKNKFFQPKIKKPQKNIFLRKLILILIFLCFCGVV